MFSRRPSTGLEIVSQDVSYDKAVFGHCVVVVVVHPHDRCTVEIVLGIHTP